MKIGSKLKNARNSKRLTQEQVAEILGVSRQTISNWENNKSYPDIISVIKMSDIYNFGYMLIGIIIAVCGISIGSFWNRK